MSSTQTKCLINVQRIKYHEQNDPELPNNGEFFKTHMFVVIFDNISIHIHSQSTTGFIVEFQKEKTSR